MTDWLVTGAGGMLGAEVVALLGARTGAGGPLAGDSVRGPTRRELDVTDAAAVTAAVRGADVVVNAAAWTDVDGAESAEAAAFAVNADGAALLAAACAAGGARLVHLSTDYVFAGDSTTPYAEDAPVAPRSAYGRSKAAGEQAVRAAHPGSWIVRTAWLYGAHGPNFVRTMLRLAAERPTLDVVDDQRGQPTWARDVAAQIVDLVVADAPPGTYHATSSGDTTWFGLTREILARIGSDPQRVRPTTTARFPRPAPRPAYSVLGHDGWRRAGLAPIRDWRAALDEALPALVAAGT
jgi:dTDP-4-dehydrorhamnose reductase